MEETVLTRCRQAPRSRQEEARAPCVPGTAGGPQRTHQRLPRQVWEGGKESRRRTWGLQVGVQQKMRRQEASAASLGCKVTVAVGGGGGTLIHEYLCVLKRKIDGTLPCTGEERGRQRGARGRCEGAGGLRGGPLVGGGGRLLRTLVPPATAQSYWGRLETCRRDRVSQTLLLSLLRPCKFASVTSNSIIKCLLGAVILVQMFLGGECLKAKPCLKFRNS